MATPKPGEIRCPTCHRSTPPAAYCTQCGSPIPPDARVRPRGLDRDELQERIRMRRVGPDPYRRGVASDDLGGGSGAGAYQRFEPEPGDANAVRPERAEAEPRVDHFDERPRPRAVPLPPPPPDVTREPEPDRFSGWHQPAPTAVPPPPDDTDRGEPRYDEEPTYRDEGDDYGYGPGAYPYQEEWGSRRRGAGMGGVVILGFLALGVLALLGGAVLAGVFDDTGVGATSPSPTPTALVTAEPSVAPTATLPATPTDSPSGSGAPGGSPVEFPDGMVGDVEPCATEGMTFDGCDVDGSTIQGDRMWAWIGFTDASGDDELVLILRFGEQTVQQVSYVLGDTLDCPNRCTGYLRQGFTGLNPGDYELVLERNGDFADRASFTVGG